MKLFHSVRAVLLCASAVLGGCTTSATLGTAIVDIKIVAAKVDAAVKVAVAQGMAAAQNAYTFTVDELPAACSLARSEANLIDAAGNLGAFGSLSAKDQVLIAQVKAALGAAGSSTGCLQVASGIAPANPTEAATVIVSAFVAARIAVRNTNVAVTATVAAGS